MPAPKKAALASQEPTQSAPAAQADPGPPPVRPALSLALYGHPTAEMLFDAASPQGDHERANAADAGVIAIRRERLVGVDIMRQPPEVHQYKAELVSWLDALASFHAK